MKKRTGIGIEEEDRKKGLERRTGKEGLERRKGKGIGEGREEGLEKDGKWIGEKDEKKDWREGR